MRLAATIVLAAALTGCGSTAPRPAPAKAPAVAATTARPSLSASPTPSPTRTAVIQSEDLDVSYTPGAYCSTSRLGKTFVKDGKTYTCKAPKPYRWRR